MRHCDGCETPKDDKRWFNEHKGQSLCLDCTKRADRLIAAIRAFTVDVDGGDTPNGRTERAIDALGSALERGAVAVAGQAFVEFCESSALDTKELREAAEAVFGGDFRKP